MDRSSALGRLSNARSAQLATVTAAGAPHIVPIVFALDQGRVVTAVDHKPKSTTRLRRLANIEHQPRVSLLVDHYSDDWDQLWWVRVDGPATLVDPAAPGHAAIVAPLRDKYMHYAAVDLGTAIVITIDHVAGWSATD
jgi:PPOX class probable F420-dependent enzyme